MIAKSMLVVDDEPAIRYLLREWFLRKEFQVATAGNGREAAQQCLDHRFDIILLDSAMPVMGGAEALPLLRASQPAASIVVFTGSTQDSSFFVERGAAAVVSKPLSLRLVESEVNRVLHHLPQRQAVGVWPEVLELAMGSLARPEAQRLA